MPALPTLRGLEGRSAARPAPPATRRRLDVYAYSRPAGTFTGDFYLTRREGRGIWLALGDVAGKGLPAAVFMAMIQEKLEEVLSGCAARNLHPVEALRRVNEFLLSQLPANRFATAIIAHLAGDGTLEVANAGHCAALIRRRGGGIEPIAPTGPVLGVLEDPNWSSVTTRLRSAETLLLYSDGLVEAGSVRAGEFGVPRVMVALAEAGSADAREISGSIVGAVDRHSGGARDDDLTLVVARRPF
jgi:sigma-B regulation protein RsbU (phosphoserine phosphatase)